jgi:hypothetical protein
MFTMLFDVSASGTCLLCRSVKRLITSEVGAVCLTCFKAHALALG